MTVRFYSSIAQQTTLTGTINPAATAIMVADATGFPSSTPFTLALDYGAVNEELVDVTNLAGTSLTITRAVDGTSATTHAAGAIVRHVSSARDFADSRAHENASTGVHGLGVGSAVVGTLDVQTLENKTLADTTFSDPTITGTVLGGASYSGITLTGATTANGTVNVNSTNAASNPLTVKGTASQTAALQQWQNNAAVTLANVGADGVVHADQGVTANAATSSSIAAVVKAASGQTANLQQWQNSLAVPLSAVSNTGQFQGYHGMTITGGNSSSSTPFTVSGVVGQTGDLATVFDPTRTNKYFNVEADGRTSVTEGLDVLSGDLTAVSPLKVGGVDQGAGFQEFRLMTQIVLNNTTETALGTTLANIDFLNNRAYRIYIWGYASSTTASYLYLRVRKGSGTGGDIWVDQLRIPTLGTVALNVPVSLMPIVRNTSGSTISTQLTLTGQATAGSTPAQWSSNGNTVDTYFYVEDIGLATDYQGFSIA